MLAAVERLDLEGILAKRLRDPYAPEVEWRKIKNGAYTQIEGRGELLYPKTPARTVGTAHGSVPPSAEVYGWRRCTAFTFRARRLSASTSTENAIAK